MVSPAMPTTGSRAGARPHVVLLPSAGIGHLLPFSRLALALSSGHACDVSVVTVLPTVSFAESRHLQGLLDATPAVRRLDLHLAPFDASEFPGADPFFLRFEGLRRSAPLLGPLLADAGALALVADIALASVVIPVAKDIRLDWELGRARAGTARTWHGGPGGTRHGDGTEAAHGWACGRQGSRDGGVVDSRGNSRRGGGRAYRYLAGSRTWPSPVVVGAALVSGEAEAEERPKKTTMARD